MHFILPDVIGRPSFISLYAFYRGFADGKRLYTVPIEHSLPLPALRRVLVSGTRFDLRQTADTTHNTCTPSVDDLDALPGASCPLSSQQSRLQAVFRRLT